MRRASRHEEARQAATGWSWTQRKSGVRPIIITDQRKRPKPVHDTTATPMNAAVRAWPCRQPPPHADQYRLPPNAIHRAGKRATTPPRRPHPTHAPQRRQRAARCKPVRTSPRVGALGSRAIETESAASTELRGACQTASQNPRQSRSEAGIPRSAMGSDDKPVHDDTATLASGVRQSGPISSMGRSVGLSLCHPVRERDKHQGTQVLGKRQSPAPGRM